MKVYINNTHLQEDKFRINKYTPDRIENANKRERFLVVKGHKHILLKAEDIAYFVVESRITTAVTFRDERFLLHVSLDKLEEELDNSLFYRANRSTIINIEAFDYFENYFNGKLMVKLKTKSIESITISRMKAPGFKEWLDH
nr:LytTR family DNA-binding domain-containing protein [uncultured Carboxylicivirga sp.]